MRAKTETQELTTTSVAIDHAVRFTLYRGREPDVLSKTYRLTKKGHLEKVAPGGLMRRGEGVICRVSGLNELAAFLPTMDHGDAISWGLPKDVGDGEVVTVVADALVDRVARSGSQKVISRTRDNYQYPTGRPGIFMIDIDEVGPGRPALTDAGQVAGLISDVISGSEDVEILVVPSGSSNIKNSETGEMLRGVTGWRAYIIVEDASDIPRLGSILFKRLWLLGEGFIRASESGAALVRAPVDASVFQPERLDFVGGASLGPGLVQELEQPVVFPGARQTLDSRRVPDLSDEEEAEYQALVAAAKLAMKPDLQRKAVAAIERQVAKRVKADATEAERATVREAVQRTLNDTNLPPEHVIEVRVGNEWRQVTVAEIVSNRSAYDGKYTRDPHEPDYDGGRPIGQIYVNDSGVWLHSFAHGQTTYFLEGSDTIWAELWDQLGIRLTALHPAEIAAAQQAHAEAEARSTEAERQLSDPQTWNIAIGCAGLEGWDRMRRIVANLQARYVFFPNGGVGERIVDTFTGVGYPRDSFATMHASYKIDLPTGEEYLIGPKAGLPKLKEYNPALLMLEDAEMSVGMTQISGYQFDPSRVDRLIDAGGETKLNLYQPPTFFEGAGDPVDWFLQFMEYLIPDADERDWVINWLAYKVQHPGQRGAGVMLVTPEFGAGRNVLFRIVRELLGERWCGAVGSDVLLGTSGQSQYDDVFLNKVLITCDEIGMAGASYDRRVQAYERLKSIVDPEPQDRTLNRKGLSPISGKVYYSALMASNHPTDALPLAAGDRRFAIITCTRTPMVNAKTGAVLRPDIVALLEHAVPRSQRSRASAIRGLHDYLMSLPTNASAFKNPPMTEAKQTMIEDGEGDVEETIRKFLSLLPEDQSCFWFDDLVRRGEEWLDRKPAVRNGFKHIARKLLRNGFAGWTYPNKPTRFGPPGPDQPSGKCVVHRDGMQDTPEGRARWLCDGPLRGLGGAG